MAWEIANGHEQVFKGMLGTLVPEYSSNHQLLAATRINNAPTPLPV